MKNALFLQSWYSKITDNWYPWVKAELIKKNYIVHFPDIAEFRQDAPDLNKILVKIISLNCVNHDSVVMGHSLGSLAAMRLAETTKLSNLILVSAWDFDDLTPNHKFFWQTKINHAQIIANTTIRHVIHSDNDPYITAFQAQEMANRLQADFTLIKGAGHFTSEDGISQIPELIKLV
jgi:uncharacterized protein